MKSSNIIAVAFVAISLFLSISASAQDDREDVVYLKNGNIYRGIIIEQVPGETLKVETIGGNVFTVAISDVMKIAKEKKVVVSPPEPPKPTADYSGHMRRDDYWHHAAGDSAWHRTHGHYPQRGYFMQVELLADNTFGAFHIIDGYRFGRFATLGIGIGVDAVKFSPFTSSSNPGGNYYPYAGTYLPIFLYYSGDILKRAVTPFYTVEAGYDYFLHAKGIGMFNGSGQDAGIGLSGGAMGEMSFGIKVRPHGGRVNLNFSAVLDVKDVHYYNYAYIYYPNGAGGSYYTTQSNKTDALLAFPGVKFGLGF